MAGAYTGSKWGASDAAGTPGGVVTWSFNLAGADLFAFDGSILAAPFQAAVRAAFDLWESVANIDFREVSTGSAQIQLGWDMFDGAGGTLGQAYWTYRGAQTIQAEVAFDRAEDWSPTPGSGKPFLSVAIHEIGHTIGLAHTDDPTSIMYPYLSTPTLPNSADIAAIQSLYGPATVSVPSPTVGTLTGTDGNDALVWSQNISRVAGGGGADTITAATSAGSAVTIFGGREMTDPNDSADSITVSGQGAAIVYGNGGDDLIDYRATGVGTLYGGAGNDVFRIENGAANQIFGGPGSDSITVTGNGANTIFGAQAITDPVDASDTIQIVGNGSNLVYANGGDDRVAISGSGNNTVYGGVGNDTLTGGSGADWFYGNPGNDLLSGDKGNDVLTGGTGSDTFVFLPGGGADIVTDFRFAEGDRLVLSGRAYTIGATSDGSAQLLLADGDMIILQGVTPTEFSQSYVA